MRRIAQKYIEDAAKPGEPLPTPSDIVAGIRKYRAAFIFGALSIALYSLLYHFNVDLIQIAKETHNGHKALFFVPIVIALIFSLIHGAFTSHFWDVLGVKAKK